MKVIFNTLYYALIAAMVGTGVLFAATLVPVFGVEVKVVKSGSMEPKIPVGSLVVIHPAASYNVGDVITFGADTKTQIPTTHRIVATEGSGSSLTFQTKGDANNAPDPKATSIKEVHGKVFAAVPYLGYLLAFARTPLGFGFLVGVPALMIVLEEGLNIVREIALMRRKKKRPMGVSPTSTTSRVVPVGEKSIDGMRRMQSQGVRLPVKHIVASTVAVVMVIGFGLYSNREGDTAAAYQDVETSAANKLVAAAVYPSTQRAQLDEVLDFQPLVLGASSVTEEATDTPETPAETEPPVEAVEDTAVTDEPAQPFEELQLPPMPTPEE